MSEKKFASGRRAALQCLDELFEDAGNIQKLHQGFQDALDADAVGFFKGVVLPTLPKESLIQLESKSEDMPVRIEIVPATSQNKTEASDE